MKIILIALITIGFTGCMLFRTGKQPVDHGILEGIAARHNVTVKELFSTHYPILRQELSDLLGYEVLDVIPQRTEEGEISGATAVSPSPGSEMVREALPKATSGDYIGAAAAVLSILFGLGRRHPEVVA